MHQHKQTESRSATAYPFYMQKRKLSILQDYSIVFIAKDPIVAWILLISARVKSWLFIVIVDWPGLNMIITFKWCTSSALYMLMHGATTGRWICLWSITCTSIY